jgi:hypothetical protein
MLYSNRSLTPQHAAGNALAPGFVAILRSVTSKFYHLSFEISRFLCEKYHGCGF